MRGGEVFRLNLGPGKHACQAPIQLSSRVPTYLWLVTGSSDMMNDYLYLT